MSRKSVLNANRPTILLSAAATLLGMLMGILLWSRLPGELPVHFDFAGQPDSYAPKAFAVFGLPLILLGFQGICIWAAVDMPPAQHKLRASILWIVPLISLGVFVLLYAYALGSRPDIGFWMQIILGTVLVLLGNALPKNPAALRLSFRRPELSLNQKQKIARFAGYCLVVGGIALFLCALSGSAHLFLGVTGCVAILPTVYALRQRAKTPRES